MANALFQNSPPVDEQRWAGYAPPAPPQRPGPGFSTAELNAPEHSSDEFRMFRFKVARCSKRCVHDWRGCAYSHPTENARRRDPRCFRYLPVPCPEYKRGICLRGDACTYAHGVYECWLHPARYRTQLCKEGAGCTRPVCFFAHQPSDLRVPTHVWTDLIPAARKGGGADRDALALLAQAVASGHGSSLKDFEEERERAREAGRAAAAASAASPAPSGAWAGGRDPAPRADGLAAGRRPPGPDSASRVSDDAPAAQQPGGADPEAGSPARDGPDTTRAPPARPLSARAPRVASDFQALPAAPPATSRHARGHATRGDSPVAEEAVQRSSVSESALSGRSRSGSGGDSAALPQLARQLRRGAATPDRGARGGALAAAAAGMLTPDASGGSAPRMSNAVARKLGLAPARGSGRDGDGSRKGRRDGGATAGERAAAAAAAARAVAAGAGGAGRGAPAYEGRGAASGADLSQLFRAFAPPLSRSQGGSGSGSGVASRSGSATAAGGSLHPGFHAGYDSVTFDTSVAGLYDTAAISYGHNAMGSYDPVDAVSMTSAYGGSSAVVGDFDAAATSASAYDAPADLLAGYARGDPRAAFSQTDYSAAFPSRVGGSSLSFSSASFYPQAGGRPDLGARHLDGAAARAAPQLASLPGYDAFHGYSAGGAAAPQDGSERAAEGGTANGAVADVPDTSPGSRNGVAPPSRHAAPSAAPGGPATVSSLGGVAASAPPFYPKGLSHVASSDGLPDGFSSSTDVAGAEGHGTGGGSGRRRAPEAGAAAAPGPAAVPAASRRDSSLESLLRGVRGLSVGSAGADEHRARLLAGLRRHDSGTDPEAADGSASTHQTPYGLPSESSLSSFEPASASAFSAFHLPHDLGAVMGHQASADV